MGIEFYGESGNGPTLTKLGLDYEHPAFLSFNIGNGAAMLALLGLSNDHGMGNCTMPEARRAIMQARARFERKAPEHVRAGYDTKKPGRARVIMGGLDEDGLASRLDRFEEFINTMDRMGAERIRWA
jgi:hypothetical protein